jgi:cell division septation protein DedD
MRQGPEGSAGTDAVREFRLEGVALWAAFSVLAALLALAFWAGRWTAPAGAGSGDGAPGAAAGASPAAAAPTEVPVEQTLNFFDRDSGEGQVAEPRREADRGAGSPDPARRAAPAAKPPSGEWFVQVFAGRDRQAAELVSRQLRDRGHPVRLDAEREGSGSLYKVRVGGYESREEADRAAGVLRKEGSSGAWVTRLAR